MNLIDLSSFVTAKTTLRDKISFELTQIKKDLIIAKKYSIIINNTQGLFEHLLNTSRANIQKNLSSIVTLALREILQTEEIEFVVEFEFKRNQPEAFLYIKYKGFKGSIPESFGGGIEDAVSTVLKLIFTHLLQIKGPIFLDEPAKWLDPESSVRFAQFLKQLSEKFDMQLFLVTHKAELSDIADKLFVCRHDGERSEVSCETS